MAGSSEYYKKYQEEKKKAEGYEKNIKELQSIQNSLTGDMYDEIRNVNNELDELRGDLNQSVRHNAVYDRTADSLREEKEKAVTADGTLKVAVNEIQEEITRLTNLKRMAEQNRDNYYRDYQNAKEREEREAREARERAEREAAEAARRAAEALQRLFGK